VIPSALLLVGTFVAKQELFPYAVALAAVFSAVRLSTSGGMNQGHVVAVGV
jgi:cytochrome-b5 reductase